MVPSRLEPEPVPRRERQQRSAAVAGIVAAALALSKEEQMLPFEAARQTLSGRKPSAAIVDLAMTGLAKIVADRLHEERERQRSEVVAEERAESREMQRRMIDRSLGRMGRRLIDVYSIHKQLKCCKDRRHHNVVLCVEYVVGSLEGEMLAAKIKETAAANIALRVQQERERIVPRDTKRFLNGPSGKALMAIMLACDERMKHLFELTQAECARWATRSKVESIGWEHKREWFESAMETMKDAGCNQLSSLPLDELERLAQEACAAWGKHTPWEPSTGPIDDDLEAIVSAR